MLYLFFLAGLILAAAGVLLLDLAGLAILWGGLLLWLAGTLMAMLLFILVGCIITRPVSFDELPEQNNKGWRRLAVVIMRIVLDLLRVRVRVFQVEQMPPTQTRFLIVGNHRSNIDPLVTAWALRKWDISYVTKPGVMKIPIAGKIIHKCGYMSLDREDNRAALKTILRAVDYIKRDVFSVGIYPEGTRNKGEGLLPFRNGAFKIAQKTNVPIVVVKLENTEKLAKNYPWRSTTVNLRVCAVLPAEFVAAHNSNEIGAEVVRILSE